MKSIFYILKLHIQINDLLHENDLLYEISQIYKTKSAFKFR